MPRGENASVIPALEAIVAVDAPVIGEAPEATVAADASVSGAPGFAIAVNAPVSAAPGTMVAGASKETEKGKRCMKSAIASATSEALANFAYENASLKREIKVLKTENYNLKIENKMLKTSSEAGASASGPSQRFAPATKSGESFEDGIYPRPPPARQDVPKAAEVETIPIPPARWCGRIERTNGSHNNNNG